MDNNSAEQAIRPFCVGKKNWVMIDTIAGAEASAIIYSIAETAKANNLKPYNYFEYLLTEIPKHMDEHDACFCEDLYILISTSDGLSPIRHRNSRKRRILPICKCAKK